MFNFEKPAEKKKTEIKPGKYLGVVAKAEVGKTKAGHKTIKMRLKLEGHPGFHFVDLNMEHEKTKDISKETLSAIFYGGIQAPVTSLKTLEDICGYLEGIPVCVVIKERVVNGEVKFSTYFNDHPAKLASKVASAAIPGSSGQLNW